jgi:hypothetical protein
MLKNTKQINNTTLILYKYFSAKNNKIIFNKTIGPTLYFETKKIHYHSCPPSYTLLDDPSKTIALHTTICIKKYMLVELCARNYATLMALLIESILTLRSISSLNNPQNSEMKFCENTKLMC